MTREEMEFYASTREAIHKHPAWLKTAISAINDGIEQRLEQASRDRTEWEAIACITMHARLFKGQELALASRIQSLMDRASFQWDAVLAKLRSKGETP